MRACERAAIRREGEVAFASAPATPLEEEDDLIHDEQDEAFDRGDLQGGLILPMTALSAGGGGLVLGGLLGVAVLAFAVMAPLCGHEFTNWDDDKTVRGNPDFNPPTLAKIGHYWTGPFLNMYAPLTYTTWAGVARLVYAFADPTGEAGGGEAVGGGGRPPACILSRRILRTWNWN